MKAFPPRGQAVHPQEAAFRQFVIQRKKDLQRIVGSARGEHQFPDVVNEAWVFAYEWAARKNVSIDFLYRPFQDLLISHLYQHLVRYTEQNVRRALRLDQADPDQDRDDESHRVMRTLVSDEGRHPVDVLIEQEAPLAHEVNIDAHHSQASAYVHLLRRFNNQMKAVANYLLISVSYAYRRCAYARLLAIHQKPAPLSTQEALLPKPWRRFRIERIPEQQAFNFDDELPLEFATCSSEGS